MTEKKPYHLSEYSMMSKSHSRRIVLSEKSLGYFCYHALKCGADIYQLWAFDPKYVRSSVFPAIIATKEQLDYLRNLGYDLVDPPTIQVN
jgi:hypothetical protein